MLEENLLSKTDYNVFTLVLGRQLVRHPTVVLHSELVDDVRGPRHEPCNERASIGHCPLHSEFDEIPHGPALVLQITKGAFDMAVGLGLSGRALDERSLALHPNCNSHLERNDGRLVVVLQSVLALRCARIACGTARRAAA